jgi:hypothetical protein
MKSAQVAKNSLRPGGDLVKEPSFLSSIFSLDIFMNMQDRLLVRKLAFGQNPLDSRISEVDVPLLRHRLIQDALYNAAIAGRVSDPAAADIIRSLQSGYDPLTLKPLPAGHILNERAVAAALLSIEIPALKSEETPVANVTVQSEGEIVSTFNEAQAWADSLMTPAAAVEPVAITQPAPEPTVARVVAKHPDDLTAEDILSMPWSQIPKVEGSSNSPYSERDDAIITRGVALKKNYEVIATKFKHRTERAIAQRMYLLRSAKIEYRNSGATIATKGPKAKKAGGRWRDEDFKSLFAVYNANLSVADMAYQLEREEGAIVDLLRRIKLQRETPRRTIQFSEYAGLIQMYKTAKRHKH